MASPDDLSLVVLLGGQVVGVVTQHDGRLQLFYEDAWRESPDATPLSLSLPLSSRSHDDASVRPFLWGLLPDNEQVLERWARTYAVSAQNPFALLGHVGEDCAGAVQLVAPEEVDAIIAGAGGVEWLTEAEVADRVRALYKDPTAWHGNATGQFSLAGAQAKTALHLDPRAGHWGDPWGAVPTTHIIKPAIAGFDDHDLNEHLCLEAARMLGLQAAASTIGVFGAQRAIVIERYDRHRTAEGRVTRIHQEDMCQATGVGPSRKYENEGGPGAPEIASLLRRSVRPAGEAERAVQLLASALAFNWIIAGTDAHAKNYSVLLAGRQVRFAPLFDIASALPYDEMYLPKLRMAMRVGGEDRLTRIAHRHWTRLAGLVGLDPDLLVARISERAANIPDALATVSQRESVRSLGSPLPATLIDRVADRVPECLRALAEGDAL